MFSIPPPTASQLQPPGAGLPKLELLLARLLVGWQARRATRQSAADLFARERTAILALARSGVAARDEQRVLIKRPVGLEDSSRYWSVYMTMDHLRIVNHGTGELIRLLGRGETPARVTGTADVKPAPGVGRGGDRPSSSEPATSSIRAWQAVDDLRATPRWPHPWFGPLNAADWHFFTAFHMGLHRRQVEAIRKVQSQKPIEQGVGAGNSTAPGRDTRKYHAYLAAIPIRFTPPITRDRASQPPSTVRRQTGGQDLPGDTPLDAAAARRHALLHDAVLPTLLRLALPTVVVLLRANARQRGGDLLRRASWARKTLAGRRPGVPNAPADDHHVQRWGRRRGIVRRGACARAQAGGRTADRLVLHAFVLAVFWRRPAFYASVPWLAWTGHLSGAWRLGKKSGSRCALLECHLRRGRAHLVRQPAGSGVARGGQRQSARAHHPGRCMPCWCLSRPR